MPRLHANGSKQHFIFPTLDTMSAPCVEWRLEEIDMFEKVAEKSGQASAEKGTTFMVFDGNGVVKRGLSEVEADSLIRELTDSMNARFPADDFPGFGPKGG